jgi:hypothetical protein
MMSRYIAPGNFNSKMITMKKVLAFLAMALFIGGLTAPVVAAINNDIAVITLGDEDPDKKVTTEKKAETTAKSSDCASGEKTETAAAAKSSDCTSGEKTETAAATKKSDCSSTTEKGQTASK